MSSWEGVCGEWSRGRLGAPENREVDGALQLLVTSSYTDCEHDCRLWTTSRKGKISPLGKKVFADV